MKVDVVKIIDAYGKDKARALIVEKCYTLVEFHKEVGLSKASNRTSSRIYEEAFRYLSISEIPYKEDTRAIRLLKVEFDRTCGRYWESDYISEFLTEKLLKPVINKSGDSVRGVISFPKHPKADPTSNQIKAHMIAWELVNEQYVPDNCWVMPLDGNYLNLDVTNLVLKKSVEVKSERTSGINNPSYIHGRHSIDKLGGWPDISKKHITMQPYCSLCSNDNMLIVHHIISYHLFKNPVDAHTDTNLLVLCRHCHGKLHQNKFNIKAHIEEIRYCKLLELLETLKSQVPDSLMETYRDVEKQLGLTDNQQPSTYSNFCQGEGSTTIPKGSRAQESSKQVTSIQTSIDDDIV